MFSYARAADGFYISSRLTAVGFFPTWKAVELAGDTAAFARIIQHPQLGVVVSSAGVRIYGRASQIDAAQLADLVDYECEGPLSPNKLPFVVPTEYLRGAAGDEASSLLVRRQTEERVYVGIYGAGGFEATRCETIERASLFSVSGHHPFLGRITSKHEPKPRLGFGYGHIRRVNKWSPEP